MQKIDNRNFNKNTNIERKRKMNKIKKIFALSALAVCLAGMVFAFGSSAGSESKPEIISKNVMYTDKFILMYAVDAETVEGNEAILNVYKEYPTENSTPICTLRDTTAETITKADGTTYNCYVFITNGIAATEFTTNYYVTVTDGADRVSDVARYSVAEYLNERLYKNGIAAITEGDDAVRKDFYLSTLAFGANAENVLFNLDDDKENDRDDLVTDYKYIYTDLGTIDGEFSSGVYAPETALKFTAYDTTKKYQTTEILASGADGDGTAIAADGSFTVETNLRIDFKAYERGEGKFYNMRNDITTDSKIIKDFTSTSTTLPNNQSGRVNASVIDGASVHELNQANENYVRIEGASAPTITDYITVVEYDFKYSGFDTSKIQANYFSAIRIYDSANQSGNWIRFSKNSDNTLSLGNGSSLAADKWYNIRLEIVYGSNNTATADVYINNEYTTQISFANVTKHVVKFWLYMHGSMYNTGSTTQGQLHFDNVFFGHIDTKYKTVNN